jgi:hypothetical protein
MSYSRDGTVRNPADGRAARASGSPSFRNLVRRRPTKVEGGSEQVAGGSACKCSLRRPLPTGGWWGGVPCDVYLWPFLFRVLCAYGVMFDSPALSLHSACVCSVCVHMRVRVPWPHLSMGFHTLVVPPSSHHESSMLPHACGSTPLWLHTILSSHHESSAGNQTFHIRQPDVAWSSSSRPSSRPFRRGHRRG